MEEPEEDVIRSLKAMFDLPSRWEQVCGFASGDEMCCCCQ